MKATAIARQRSPLTPCSPWVVAMMTLLASIITFSSGTVADEIHSRNPHGAYVRPYVVPFDPNTILQDQIRNRFAAISKRWGDTLTPAQRDAWATYAANVPVPSVSGRKQYLSAQQMYIRCNMPRGNPIQNAVDDGPTVFNHGEFSTPTVETIQFVDLILVLFTGDDAWMDQDGSRMIVQVSDGQSTGINFFAGPFRGSGQIPGSSTSPPDTGATLFDPFVPHALGPRWARVRISFADGRLSPARIFEFLPIPP